MKFFIVCFGVLFSINLYSQFVLPTNNYNKGLILFNSQNYDSAIVVMNKVIQEEPDSGRAYYIIGRCYQNMKEYKNAVDNYEIAISKGKKSSRVYFAQAFCYDELKQYDKALIAYSNAIRLTPTYAQAYYNRGLIKYNIGKTDEACSDFKKAYQYGYTDAGKLIKENCN